MTGEPLKDVHHALDPVCFSATGTLVATRTAPDELAIIDSASRSIILRIADPDWSFSDQLTFSSDDRFLIDISPVDFRVRAWRLRDLFDDLKHSRENFESFSASYSETPANVPPVVPLQVTINESPDTIR